jgi:hypothetical protein
MKLIDKTWDTSATTTYTCTDPSSRMLIGLCFVMHQRSSVTLHILSILIDYILGNLWNIEEEKYVDLYVSSRFKWI